MEATLYKDLKPKAPDFSYLHERYSPLLQLVNILIGTVPKCDPIMELWPTSFKTYNLLVPNLLNLPKSLLGNKSVKKLMGLAMYESSLSSGCNYCTAHCCSFAVRRGLDEQVIKGAPGDKEAAVINFAQKMGEIPCNITKSDLDQMTKHCTAAEVDAVSMGIVLMGFLNKFMDAMGIELEQEAIDDVSELLEHTKWEVGKHVSEKHTKPKTKKIKADNLLTYLKVFTLAPGAIKLEKEFLEGVPNESIQIEGFLKSDIGYEFPVLNKLKRPKLKRVFAAVLSDNFSEVDTYIGRKSKILCGLVFSSVIKNESLKEDLMLLASGTNIQVDRDLEQLLVDFSNDYNKMNTWEQVELSFTTKEVLALKLAHKASTSPTDIQETLINEVTNDLEAESIVELVTWISILQALHRLHMLPEY